ncbi:MAG: cation diffusion facilitator family transporter, partial [Planctomycetaceae bacterium]
MSELKSDVFPEPVSPPVDLQQARSRRTARLVRFAAGGIGVRALIIALELAGFALLGHAVLLVDAVASTADVAASLLIHFAIKLAERPPDKEHPFGHGRYEPLAGLQLGVLICLLGGWMLIRQAAAAATGPMGGHVHPLAAMIPLLAAVLMEVVCRLILRVGRREHSSALIAEAYHYRMDACTSLAAAAALCLAGWLPSAAALIDHASATLLAGVMVVLGLLACRANLNQLLDRAPAPERFDRVRRSAEKIPGVLDVEKVRIQTAGPDAHVDIDIEVDPQSSVTEAHRITQHVRAQIQTDWPAVREVVVHVEPFYEG